MNRPSMLKPALIGGLTSGVVSAIPLVGALNCACCSLVIGGGFLAGYLYSKDAAAAGAEFRAGAGATVGLTTAPFFALGYALPSTLVNSLMGGANLEMIEQQLESQGQSLDEMPPFFMRMLEIVGGGAGFLLMMLVFLLLGLVLGLIFCTIGGLISGAVFKKEATSTSTVDVGPGGEI